MYIYIYYVSIYIYRYAGTVGQQRPLSLFSARAGCIAFAALRMQCMCILQDQRRSEQNNILAPRHASLQG